MGMVGVRWVQGRCNNEDGIVSALPSGARRRMPWNARPRGVSSTPQGQGYGQGESLAQAMLGKVNR